MSDLIELVESVVCADLATIIIAYLTPLPPLPFEQTLKQELSLVKSTFDLVCSTSQQDEHRYYGQCAHLHGPTGEFMRPWTNGKPDAWFVCVSDYCLKFRPR
jgi:hypothetical protein